MTTKQIGGYTVYLSQVLGHGSYGNVYRGVKDDDQQPVAVKIIPKYMIDTNEYLRASLNNEIRILQCVRSEHIVGFEDVMESPKNYYIIQELCDHDLAHAMRLGEEMPEAECINILTQLCTGFLALVREGIIHRDLKPANIMVRGKTYKLGDFGFSKQLSTSSNGYSYTTVGTPLYMSLEILKSLAYTSKCDIWALGFIFYEMLHGATPWKGNRQYQLAHNIQTQPFVIRRKDLSPNTVSFLKGTLQIYEKDRLSWNEVFMHPIFNGRFTNMADENKEFENQMKSIMTKLRFYFNLNRTHLENYLNKHGFMNKDQDLTFDQYFDFLKAVNPSITQTEAIYIFNRTDIDNSGTISIDEIISMLKTYGINITPNTSLTKVSSNQEKKPLQSSQKLSETDLVALNKAAGLLKNVFVKLHKIIVRHNFSLKKVFNDFDKQRKGSLSYHEFRVMVQKMCKDITDEQARLAFKMIDEDDSDSLEYAEMEKHYRLINQISQNDDPQ